jgi:hypothetical protein
MWEKSETMWRVGDRLSRWLTPKAYRSGNRGDGFAAIIHALKGGTE